MRYRLLFIIGILCSSVYANTVAWETMFAYNAVSQIAVSTDKVYALSVGALFSVNKHLALFLCLVFLHIPEAVAAL